MGSRDTRLRSLATETASTTRGERDGIRSARTIGALWRRAVSEPRPFPAYLVEEEGGGWREVSWDEAGRRVEELANGLLAQGIRKGDAVGIVATTRLEWALLDFALACIGAVVTPVYPNSSPADTAYVLEHSESVAVFVEDESQAEKVESRRDEMPRVARVVRFDELDSLAERGREFARTNPGALDEAAARVDEEDLFTYIYTSGTTGPPKGCMIRHRNYYEMAVTVDRLEDFAIRGDTMLLYLPLAHNFGRLMHLLGPHVGFTLALLSDPMRAGEVMPAVRPTTFPSVPRLYEKVYAAVKSQFDAATGTKAKLIRWALRVGYRTSELRQRGEPPPRALVVQHRLADRLVYSKVKKRLGGRLRAGISGGAPLSWEIAEFLHALDILVLEGYGLTECTTACSVNRPQRFRFGSVGPALPGFDLKTDEDGEILIRSETLFAGYLKDPEATREVLGEDGWLRSGDIGRIDDDGFLFITDRKKDIIVTAGGKNVAPQNLENALKSTALVSQALVVGDRKPYVAALITLDEQAAATWASPRGLPSGVAELSRHPELVAEIQAAVDGVNRERSRFEQIKRFAVLPRDFTAEADEVTPTLKLRRRQVEQHFASEIEALYTG